MPQSVDSDQGVRYADSYAVYLYRLSRTPHTSSLTPDLLFFEVLSGHKDGMEVLSISGCLQCLTLT